MLVPSGRLRSSAPSFDRLRRTQEGERYYPTRRNRSAPCALTRAPLARGVPNFAEYGVEQPLQRQECALGQGTRLKSENNPSISYWRLWTGVKLARTASREVCPCKRRSIGKRRRGRCAHGGRGPTRSRLSSAGPPVGYRGFARRPRPPPADGDARSLGAGQAK